MKKKDGRKGLASFAFFFSFISGFLVGDLLDNKVVRMQMGWISGSKGDTLKGEKGNWRRADIPLREQNQGSPSIGSESREGES